MPRRLIHAATLSILAAFAVSASVFAQDKVCSDVLGSVRDTSDTSYSYYYSSSFERFFCNKTYSSWKDASDAGLQVGIVLQGLPISIGGYDREQHWGEYSSLVCETIKSHQLLNVEWRQKIETINAQVIDAWSKCIASGKGIQFWMEINQAQSGNVILGLRNQTETTPYERKLLSKYPLPAPLNAAACKEMLPATITPSPQYVQCSRPTPQGGGHPSVAFKIAIEGAGQRLVRLPEDPPLPSDAGTAQALIVEHETGWLPAGTRTSEGPIGHLDAISPLEDAAAYSGELRIHRGNDERFVMATVTAQCVVYCDPFPSTSADPRVKEWGAKPRFIVQDPPNEPGTLLAGITHWKPFSKGGAYWRMTVSLEKFSNSPITSTYGPVKVLFGSLAYFEIPNDRVSAKVTFNIKEPVSNIQLSPIEVSVGSPVISDYVDFVGLEPNGSKTLYIYRVHSRPGRLTDRDEAWSKQK